MMVTAATFHGLVNLGIAIRVMGASIGGSPRVGHPPEGQRAGHQGIRIVMNPSRSAKSTW